MAFKCPICGNEYETRQALGGHMRGHNKQIKQAKKEAGAEQIDEPSKMLQQNAIANSMEQNEAESRVIMQEQEESKMLQQNAIAKNASKMPANATANTQQNAQLSGAKKVSAQELAWLNAQLDTPVTQEELDAAQQRMNAKYEQMEHEAAAKAAALRAPPPPPDVMVPQRGPGIPEKIAGQINWDNLSSGLMNLLIEIIRERRAARSGPSLAEQIGNLAISNFAQQLSRERGRALGKKVVDPDEEYVTSPVEQTMLDMMSKQIEEDKKNREEMAERYDKLLEQIRQAKKKDNDKMEEIKEKAIDASYRTESPNDTEAPESQAHEQPEIPENTTEGEQA